MCQRATALLVLCAALLAHSSLPARAAEPTRKVAPFTLKDPRDRATVALADSGTADGVVRLVSPRIDAATRLGKVRISLPVRALTRKTAA